MSDEARNYAVTLLNGTQYSVTSPLGPTADPRQVAEHIVQEGVWDTARTTWIPGRSVLVVHADPPREERAGGRKLNKRVI